MAQPILLLVPLLMLSDYLLTIAGARMRERVYAAHFDAIHYELNPIWQRAVAKRRWFNARHIAITAIVTILLFVGVRLAGDDTVFLPALMGALVGVLGAVNGRHLANIATFAYLDRHRDALRGTVAMSHELLLFMSMFNGLTILIPAVLLLVLSPLPITIGFATGSAILFAIHLAWILRGRRSRRRPAPKPPAQKDSA